MKREVERIFFYSLTSFDHSGMNVKEREKGTNISDDDGVVGKL